jgi:hypothetical protein
MQLQPTIRSNTRPLDAIGAAAPAATAISLTATLAEQGNHRICLLGCSAGSTASQAQQPAADAAAGCPNASFAAAGAGNLKAVVPGSAGHTTLRISSSNTTETAAGKPAQQVSVAAQLSNVNQLAATPKQLEHSLLPSQSEEQQQLEEEQQNHKKQQQQQQLAGPLQPVTGWGFKLRQLFSLSGATANTQAAANHQQQHEQQQQQLTSMPLQPVEQGPHTEQYDSISDSTAATHRSVAQQAEGAMQEEDQQQQQQQQRQQSVHRQQPFDNEGGVSEQQGPTCDTTSYQDSNMAQALYNNGQHAYNDDDDYYDDEHADAGYLEQLPRCGDYAGL